MAIFGWGSWYDGAAADTVIRRFVNFSNSQIGVIGAWAHNSESHASPYGKPKSPPVPDLKTQWHEARRFFEQRFEAQPVGKVLHYYNLGEEQWKSTEVWPPLGSTAQRWYLSDNHTLALNAPADRSGVDEYPIDFEASTGTQNRWHTEDGVTPVIYPDRAAPDRRLLTYTSAVLDRGVQNQVIRSSHSISRLRPPMARSSSISKMSMYRARCVTSRKGSCAHCIARYPLPRRRIRCLCRIIPSGRWMPRR